MINLDSENNIDKQIYASGLSSDLIFVENEDADKNEVLVLSGLSRITHLPANYTIQVNPLP